MKFKILLFISFVCISIFGQGGFTLDDGEEAVNIVTVTIGSQVWMTKNLEVCNFRNGEIIPEAKTPEEWEAAKENKQAAWCYYDNNPANGTKYGKLYNWYAVNDPRGLSPSGWYIPTDEEWEVFENSLGSEPGNKMKIAPVYGPTKISYAEEGGYYEQNYIACSNCSNWNDEYRKKVPCHICKDERVKIVKGKFIPKTKRKVEEKGALITEWYGNNSSGFSALPGGCRSEYGSFTNIGLEGFWWSTSELTEIDPMRGVGVNLQFNQNLHRSNVYKGCGYSVRCLEDNPFGSYRESNRAPSWLGNSDGGDGGPKKRKSIIRKNEVVLPQYDIDYESNIHLQLTVNANGEVLAAKCIKSKTNCYDQRIINQVENEVIRQVKYNKENGADLVYTFYTVKILAK